MEEAERHDISICVEGNGKCHLESTGTERKKRKGRRSKAEEEGCGEKRKMRQLPKEGDFGKQNVSRGF